MSNIKCLLIGPFENNGGEGNYVRSLLSNPPDKVNYIPALESRTNTFQRMCFSKFIRKPFLYPDVATKFFTINKKENFDIIHAHVNSVKFFKNKNIPIILSHSSSSCLFLTEYLHWEKSKIIKRFSRAKKIFNFLGIYDSLVNPKNVSKIILWSKFAKNIYVEFGIPEEKIVVIPPGVPTPIYKKKEYFKNGKINFLFIGRDFMRKGGIKVFNAFNRLKERYNNLSLTIVANSSSIPKNIMESIKRMHQINFIEETINKSTIEKLYLDSDIFVLPVVSEGYGLSIVEAMSFSLPIISTKIGAIPEIVMNEKNGFLISDIDELAKKMEFFIENPEYIRIYGEMGFRIFEEKFSIKNRNINIEKVYLKAINKNEK